MTGSAKAEESPTPVAVIGCGYWGRNLVRVFAELGALAAVCDADEDVAAALGDRHGAPARPLVDVIDDERIRAVAVAAPARLHAELVEQALVAGKDVFVEKPLALDVSAARRLCETAERRGRVLMVGHLMRYHPAFVELERLASAGDLGRLQYIYSNRLNLGKFRREENILWSFAPHDVSMILSLVADEPEEVWATGATYLHDAIADVTTTHLTFPGGERAHVFVSWLHPFKEQRLVVVGDRAMAVLDDSEPWESKLQLYAHQIEWQRGHPEPRRADATPVAIERAEPLVLECQHFLDRIVDRQTPRTDGREGVRVLEVLSRAQRSMSSGTRQTPRGDDRIHPSSYVDEPSEIGAGTMIWHFSHVLAGSRIGRDCSIGQNVVIGPDVTIGDRCKIQNNVSIYKGVELEDGVFCGPSCVFTNVTTPRAEINRKDEFRPTLVRSGASIGANATIVCGNEIGSYALVAAGAVVTHDVPAHAVVAGVPARQVGWVSHDGEVLDDDLVCPRSGRRYEVTESGLQEVTP